MVEAVRLDGERAGLERWRAQRGVAVLSRRERGQLAGRPSPIPPPRFQSPLHRLPRLPTSERVGGQARASGLACPPGGGQAGLADHLEDVPLHDGELQAFDVPRSHAPEILRPRPQQLSAHLRGGAKRRRSARSGELGWGSCLARLGEEDRADGGRTRRARRAAGP